jgi:hypothetical protein
MDKRVIAVTVICLLLFLVACESKTTGKRVAIPSKSTAKVSSPAITGNVVGDSSEESQAPSTGETGTSAAEALKDLQSTGTVPLTGGSKSGTFYPPVTTDATGKDALKEKTRALMSTGIAVPTTIKADDQFGAKYHSSGGDSKNLPDGYSDNDGN